MQGMAGFCTWLRNNNWRKTLRSSGDVNLANSTMSIYYVHMMSHSDTERCGIRNTKSVYRCSRPRSKGENVNK